LILRVPPAIGRQRGKVALVPANEDRIDVVEWIPKEVIARLVVARPRLVVQRINEVFYQFVKLLLKRLARLALPGR